MAEAEPLPRHLWPSRGPQVGSKMFKNFLGQRFGAWTVIARATNHNKRVRWVCRCACGTERSVAAIHLSNGHSRSCGCVRPHGPNSPRFKHGESTGELHKLWLGIIKRCEDPKQKSYPRYGGRGIKICSKWRHDYVAFRDDVGPRPSREHSLDRYPNRDGDYAPGNVRWATRKEQGRNTSRNRYYTINGETKPLSAWVEDRGLNYGTVKWRLNQGQTIEEALR